MSSIDEHEGHDRYSCDDCCQCCMICCRPFWVCCSRFRAAVRRVVEHRAFEWTILFLIMASSLTLAFEDITLEKAPVRKRIVDILNMFYVIVFTIEMCLKLFAFGVVTYFESAWHWIDSLVVAVSSPVWFFCNMLLICVSCNHFLPCRHFIPRPDCLLFLHFSLIIISYNFV